MINHTFSLTRGSKWAKKFIHAVPFSSFLLPFAGGPPPVDEATPMLPAAVVGGVGMPAVGGVTRPNLGGAMPMPMAPCVGKTGGPPEAPSGERNCAPPGGIIAPPISGG